MRRSGVRIPLPPPSLVARKFTLSCSLLLNVINLDEADTDGVVLAAHDQRVITWIERDHDRGFAVVRRSETSGFDILLIRFPIVVPCDVDAGGVKQLDHGIIEFAGDVKTRPDAAHDYFLLF